MRYKSNRYKNNGIATRTRIPRKDKEIAATAWSEGRKSLKELLLYCMENKISTIACCAGHDEIWQDEKNGKKYEDYSFGYICFSLNNRTTHQAMLPLFSEMMNLDGIGGLDFATYEENRTIDFTVHINAPLEDYVFNNILTILKQIKEGQKIQLNPMVKSIYDTITGLDRRKVEDFCVGYYCDNWRKGTYQLKEKGKQKQPTIEHLSQEELIEFMEKVQKNPELFKGKNKSVLDNIYQFCRSQKQIIYNRLLDIRYENMKAKDEGQKIEENRSREEL